LELGYRHIDTAFAYQNETAIGTTLKKWFDSGKLKREDVFIVTKVSHYCAGDKMKKNEMGRACNAYGGGEKQVLGFSGET
jgi:diketogulonate reductase-like aldo/keto reductase